MGDLRQARSQSNLRCPPSCTIQRRRAPGGPLRPQAAMLGPMSRRRVGMTVEASAIPLFLTILTGCSSPTRNPSFQTWAKLLRNHSRQKCTFHPHRSAPNHNTSRRYLVVQSGLGEQDRKRPVHFTNRGTVYDYSRVDGCPLLSIQRYLFQSR